MHISLLAQILRHMVLCTLSTPIAEKPFLPYPVRTERFAIFHTWESVKP